jgi:ATP-dependent protease ClpP protease subunit
MAKNSFNKIFEILQWCVLIALFLNASYYKGESAFLSHKYQEYVKGNAYVIQYQSDQIIKLKAENAKLYKEITDTQISRSILNIDDKYFNKKNKNTQMFSQEISDVTYAQNISK